FAPHCTTVMGKLLFKQGRLLTISPRYEFYIIFVNFLTIIFVRLQYYVYILIIF
ncbi:hypothetical protein L9F63_005859, partial [Diploptera punctata]